MLCLYLVPSLLMLGCLSSSVEATQEHSDDVDGALGWGRKFKSFTLRRMIGIVDFGLAPEDCCGRCNGHSYGHGTEFIEWQDMSCTCYKSYGRRPVSEPAGHVSGVCGQRDINVQGQLGEGWSIEYSGPGVWKPRNWKGNTVEEVGGVWDHDADISTPAKCCEECAKQNVTELFEINHSIRKCNCFVTIPGKIPMTTRDDPVMNDACV